MAILGKRDYLFYDVTLILEMPLETLLRRNIEAVEALTINAIDADDLHLAGVDPVPQGVDHAVILVLEEALPARREYQQPLAAGAEYQKLHLTLENGAVPLVVLALHGMGVP
jgi:hypothetical protein